MQSLTSIFAGFSAFGFSGSRSVIPSSLRIVTAFVPRTAPVFVGCASGVDAYVRQVFPSARVFRVSDFRASSYVGSLALRSAACVSAVAASGALFCSFPSAACPSGVFPSAVAHRCFAGSGSGSWASLAFAVGSGCSCLLFLPSGIPAPLWVASQFRQVSPSVWFLSTAIQPSLF